MPYEPGNQNNAAQYIAQAGTDVAAGIRQFQQNDLMRSTDISKFYSTAKNDTALVQFLKDPTKAPPAVAKIYEKLDSTGHISVAEAAQLGSFTDLYTKNKVEQQTSEARKAQTDLATAQGLQVGQQTAGIKAANTRLASDQTAFQEANKVPKDQWINVYIQKGGSLQGLKDLGFDVDAMLNGKPAKGMTFNNEAELEATYPKNAYDYSLVKNPNGTVTVPTVSPRAPASSNVEPGFRLKADGTGLEPTPGGSADLAIKAAQKKAESAIDSRLGQADVVMRNIDRVLPKLTGGTTGLVGVVASKVPGWEAYNVEKQIDTIKANIGFEQLADMRANSPTGGALGQIAIKELDFLQAALGNLDIGQKADQLVQTMNDIRSHYQNYKDTIAAIRAGKTELASARAPKANVPPLLAAPTAQGQGGGGDLPAGWTLKGNP